jgi:methyl-accepting chemotaxis protein
MASFAFDRKKYIQQRFAIGEGLVGTCAIEQDRIFLTEIPENYLNITSGLGESKPRSLLLVPLKLENETLGVIEIASIQVLEEFEIVFVEKLAESIASAVATVKMNMRTSRLLEQSQQQAREMASQEEIMRQHMEELKKTQEKSARRESEISGILNAIHNSSMVAEYNMDEALISINDKFQILLQVPSSQLLGKKHHEITGTSRNTDSHRQFWDDIREGKTVSRIDKISTITGQEIWLRQTYTPILDNDGVPFKVLNIASDITETIRQQESLEKQANEITRKNIEMVSFSDAVDGALIKCVYSPAGLILEVNENYENATGFTGKEMIGKNNRAFLQQTEKEQFDKIWDGLLKEKPYSGVIRRTKPTGEEVWIMSTFTPVKDENGNIYKIYLLGQDITERKLKYQLLEEANNEIERLNRQLRTSENK